MKAKYDDKKITLTTGFINAIKQLMKEELLMMREQDKKYKDCWWWGAARINDLSRIDGIELFYGAKEDKDEMKKYGKIYVEFPFLDEV